VTAAKPQILQWPHPVYSRRAIRKGEELTVDYHFANDTEGVPCKCGSTLCRGTINLPD
jgi:SET domain-containing protein